MVSNISLSNVNQNKYLEQGKIVTKNLGNTAQQVAEEAVDSFSSTAKSGMTSAAMFEGIPLLNLLRKNKKLDGKFYSEGMKNLQETLNKAKKELFKGEGKLVTRIKNYFKAVDGNQKAYSDLRKEVAKKFKESKNATKAVKEVTEEVVEETVKRAPSKLSKVVSVIKKPFAKVGSKIAEKFPKFAKAGKGFGKLMKTSGAGFMLAISGIIEMTQEVYPTFKELGAKKGMKQLGKSAVRVVGDTAGYILGAKAGAAIGSLICPGIGTVAGAAIGLVGGLLGSFVMGKITKAITGPSEREIAQKQQEQVLSQQNPFEKEFLGSTTA